MIPRIVSVRHLQDYVLELVFDDGLRAEMDFREHIVGRGDLFSALEDIEYFKQLRIELDFGTIVWPNDLDFCPEMLHESAKALADV